MIVEKLWISRKFGKDGYTKYWRGWFLFGFIPIYLKNTETQYNGYR